MAALIPTKAEFFAKECKATARKNQWKRDELVVIYNALISQRKIAGEKANTKSPSHDVLCSSIRSYYGSPSPREAAAAASSTTTRVSPPHVSPPRVAAAAAAVATGTDFNPELCREDGKNPKGAYSLDQVKIFYKAAFPGKTLPNTRAKMCKELKGLPATTVQQAHATLTTASRAATPPRAARTASLTPPPSSKNMIPMNVPANFVRNVLDAGGHRIAKFDTSPTKVKAATNIQKYWRGVQGRRNVEMIRKNLPKKDSTQSKKSSSSNKVFDSEVIRDTDEYDSGYEN